MRIGTPGFLPARLSQIRAARRIASMSELARALNLDASKISRWEKGVHSPEPETLAKLARYLGVRREYFLRPVQDSKRPVFCRKLMSAAKLDVGFQASQMEFLREIVSVVQHYVDLPTVDVPADIAPKDFRTLRDDDIEGITIQLRKHWGLGSRPCLDMVGLLERVGCVVATIDMKTAKLDGLCGWSDFDDRPQIILANDKMSFPRRQMDAAHELGHAVLHRHVTGQQLDSDLKEIERQAFRFASAFLLPADSYAPELPHMSLTGMQVAKERWRVAIKAQIMRVADLGIISRDHATILHKMYSAKGWNGGEPLDKDWPLTKPRVLRDAFDLIVSSGTRSKSELLSVEFAMSSSDIEPLAGLPSGWFDAGDAKVVDLKLREREDKTLDGTFGAQVVPFPSKR
jgi:Zn-dependent peptidase ImmA (M78 family)